MRSSLLHIYSLTAIIIITGDARYKIWNTEVSPQCIRKHKNNSNKIQTANDVSCLDVEALARDQMCAFLNRLHIDSVSIRSMRIVVKHSQLFTCSRWIIGVAVAAAAAAMWLPHTVRMNERTTNARTILFSRFYEWMLNETKKKSQMQFTA